MMSCRTPALVGVALYQAFPMGRDGFVLVSSDSDFTRLATRLREAGMKVYGMGEKKTPKPKEVLEYEKKNAGKKKIRVRDGSTGY